LKVSSVEIEGEKNLTNQLKKRERERKMKMGNVGERYLTCPNLELMERIGKARCRNAVR